MFFNSIEFLIFFPIVFIFYWFLFSKTKNLQNILIILASVFFYAWCDWKFLGLLLITTVSTFCAGILFDHYKGDNRKCWWISLCTIILNIGILFYFKYFNFFTEVFVDVFSFFGEKISLSTVKVLLPIGISFYTFSALSYSIDVYRGKIAVQKDVLAYFAYVMFFPSILSGPISRATQQLPQYLKRRTFNYGQAREGSQLLLWGFLMKLCVADRLGLYVDAVYNNISQHDGITLLLASVFYTIQIYCDFAGYSLMAIGTGKLLGIDLQTNFVRPYFAQTVTDFWRRWHISLTTWFRDYIYFPLGGNRVKKWRWMLNVMVVFIVSGIWHGAAYTFLIWGAFHGVCMIVEKLLYGDRIKSLNRKLTFPCIVRIVLTFSIVSIAWVFFRSNTVYEAFTIISKFFNGLGNIYTNWTVFFYIIPFVFLLVLKEVMEEFYPNKIKLFNNKQRITRWVSYIVVVVMILYCGVLDGGQFIYFQF
ncbi:MBOAT family O-acyltransferase [Butyricimonas virosa]|uniref:MBOAT family O-acyltransferase n=1 Tax=Butyricimonas virosa TaxID=544645 RepID=UPI0026DCE56B|nr:MBOAT family O-acyltransferase [Butyricimonas virosa]